MAEKLTLKIEGMMCDGCVRRVRNLLERAGAGEIHSVSIGSADVSVDPDGASVESLVGALEKAGYKVQANA